MSNYDFLYKKALTGSCILLDCTCDTVPAEQLVNFTVGTPTTDSAGCQSYTATCVCNGTATADCRIQIYSGHGLGGVHVGSYPFTDSRAMNVICSDLFYYNSSMTAWGRNITIGHFASALCCNN
ncbi:unnamed protein product [Enterobius vermicularis]|uniref:Uncharacterized protein n=1 Tax=Enterobius vermicularis TaxID=51028 RepID=A0A0N4VLY2_ENTVE|nr:unnamed protein product [Enterobius vermicularis]